jgi:hypothetical protein
VVSALGIHPAHGELPEGYHKVINGLASRLVAEGTYEEGTHFSLRMDVFNAGDAAVKVARGPGVEERLRLTDEKGNLLIPREREKGQIEAVSPCSIAPGKQRNTAWVYVSGSQSAMYDPLKPGRYRAVLASPEDQTDQGARLPPESNTVSFEIVPRKDVRPVPGSQVGDVLWGQEKGGLQTRIRARRNCFYPGTPVPVVLEMKNMSRKTLQYVVPGLGFQFELRVLRDGSEEPPPLTGLGQPGDLASAIKPGDTVTLEELDVTGYYLVQKPGRYTVQYPGGRAHDPYSDIPPSNVFEWEILATAISDPLERAVGVLFDACPNDWRLQASRDLMLPDNLDQPGAQWGRVPCRHYTFVQDRRCEQCPSGYRWVYSVQVWIATQKAVLEPWDLGKRTGEEWRPEEQEKQEAKLSDYLGLSPFGHVYLGRIHKTSLKCWPTAKEDIIRWLKVK